MLVTTGKAKETIGTQLTYEDKEVGKYFKPYEAFVGSITNDSLLDSFIFLLTKAVGMEVDIDDVKAYQRKLKNDYFINKELCNLS